MCCPYWAWVGCRIPTHVSIHILNHIHCIFAFHMAPGLAPVICYISGAWVGDSIPTHIPVSPGVATIRQKFP